MGFVLSGQSVLDPLEETHRCSTGLVTGGTSLSPVFFPSLSPDTSSV